MEFTKENFEQPSHGKTCDATVTPHERPTGNEIDEKHRTKDLEIINEKLELLSKKNLSGDPSD